jgi:2-dehydropantoate 2-reductase
MSERIVVIGAGPIGGIIGGRLARAGADITFVDVDTDHIQAIRENGLHVDVPDGPFDVPIEIVVPPELRGNFDIGLIAVRSNYTAEALATVLPHLSDGGILVSMQNGINPPLLEKKVGPDGAIGMAIRMGSRKLAPGRLHTATRGHLYVGHLHGRTTPQLEHIAKLFAAVIETEISDNILGVLWSKLTYTCLGYYGSLADAPLSTSCAERAQRQNLADFFVEVVATGSAAGVRWIPLAEYSPLDFHPVRAPADRLNALDRFAASWKANDRKGPLRQIQQGLKTEVDFTLGYVVAQAHEKSVPVPLCEKVLTMIHELESGRRKLSLENYAELLRSS